MVANSEFVSAKAPVDALETKRTTAADENPESKADVAPSACRLSTAFACF